MTVTSSSQFPQSKFATVLVCHSFFKIKRNKFVTFYSLITALVYQGHVYGDNFHFERSQAVLKVSPPDGKDNESPEINIDKLGVLIFNVSRFLSVRVLRRTLNTLNVFLGCQAEIHLCHIESHIGEWVLLIIMWPVWARLIVAEAGHFLYKKYISNI